MCFHKEEQSGNRKEVRHYCNSGNLARGFLHGQTGWKVKCGDKTELNPDLSRYFQTELPISPDKVILFYGIIWEVFSTFLII